MTTTILAAPALLLAEEGGGSGISAWWWLLLLLLLIPIIGGGWLLTRGPKNPDEVRHAPRPDSHDPNLPMVDLSGPAPEAQSGFVGAPTGEPVVPTAPPVPEVKKTATGDGVGSYLDADGNRVPVPIGGHLPLASDRQQAPDGYPIKGDVDTDLYHLPSDPWFAEVIAQVWFATEGAARSAGFQRAGSQDPENP
ncbi:hypothetical protein MUG78_09340 [Gordonia alkaliphila]|uniref:sunset domain-containing protein n=1 Tax=Gordonia alkaliphila TaxID=1053547 RepID=UPI001FF1A94C|nr:hypothetical protein [Gordonia alkaliphila]MCK0439659.1 hypothetical protein [Gordonia alkaliphila]